MNSLELVKQLEPETAPASSEGRERQRQLLDHLTASVLGVSEAHPRPRRHRTGRIVAIVGTAVALAGGGIAAAEALAGSPTPQQAATIYAHGYPNNGAHRTPGTRPTLNSEMVLCDYSGVSSLPAAVRDGLPGEGFASAAPLTTPLTANMLLSACDEVATTGDVVPTDTATTLCVTSVPSAQTDSPASWPIVVFGGDTCASAGAGPAPSDLLDQVNQRRNTEAAIDAVPEACPSEDQAVAWVHQQMSALDLAMQVTAWDGGPRGSCYTPSVQWWQPNSTVPVIEVTASQQSGSAPGSASSTPTTTLPAS